MFNFRQIAIAAAAAATVVVGASVPAVAGDGCVTTRTGWAICATDGYTYDRLGVAGPNGESAQMNVVCTFNGRGGNRWESESTNMTKSQLQTVASYWCRNV